MKRLQAYPMVIIMVIIIVILCFCKHFQWPVNLLYQSECSTIDSLCTYSFVLQSAPKNTAKCYRYEADVLAIWDSTEWTPLHQKALLYIQRDSTRSIPQAGDTIIAQTRLRRGGKIGGFDYGQHLRMQGFIGSAYIYRYTLHATSTYSIPLQQRLYRRLEQAGLSGDELATTGALTLGYKEDLDPQLRQHFQASGAAHVLAVSGLHTGILYTILLGLLTLCKRFRPRYENQWGRCILGCIIIAFMWGYAWITGMTPSVVRCVVMITLVEIGRMLYRNSLTINTIAAAAVLILLVRPLDLWSISFQLSFAATIAIVIFAKGMEQLVSLQQSGNRWKTWIITYILGTITVSMAAQLGTLPITMYTFGQVSNYFLLTNLIVLPIASLLVPIGLATVAFGGTPLGTLFGHASYGLAWLMNHAVAWIEQLPGSVTQVHINAWMVLLLYAAMVMGWLTMHKSLWWLLGVASTMIGFCIVYTL